MDRLLGIGIIFALIAALASGLEKIWRRKLAVSGDPLTFTFILQLFASILLLPLFIMNFSLPNSLKIWAFLIIYGFFWAVASYTSFKAFSYLETSVVVPISRIRIFFVLVLSFLLLGESLSVEKIVGTIILFAGLVVLTYKKSDKKHKDYKKGVYYAFLSAIFISFSYISSKFLVNFANPSELAFISYLIPAILLFPFVKGRGFVLKEFYDMHLWRMVVLAFFSATYFYFLLVAFNYAEASIILPVTELSSLFAVIGGIVLLKERTNLVKKIIATLIVVCGVIFISMG